MEIYGISATYLVLFALASIGLTLIVVDSFIFAWIKSWQIWSTINGSTKSEKFPDGLFGWVSHMLACYQCSGVWTGAIVAAFTLTGNGWWDIAVIPLGGFASSFLSYLAAIYLSYLEAKTIIIPTKDDQ